MRPLSFSRFAHNRYIRYILYLDETHTLLRRIYPFKICLLLVLMHTSASWANTPVTFSLGELEKLTLDRVAVKYDVLKLIRGDLSGLEKA